MASNKPKYLNKFTKSERLSSTRWIEELFSHGEHIVTKPLKAIYHVRPDLEKPQVLITVPKKNFRKASARNLLKRRIREAYRLNKHILKMDHGLYPMIAYIYLATESLPFVTIEKAVKESLRKVDRKIQNEEK